MSDVRRRLSFLFHDVARFRSILLDQLMRPHNLTRAQTHVLAHVIRKDGLTQRELAERMELSAVTLSGLIDRMEANLWVKRVPDVADRRAKRIWLQEKARDIRDTLDEQAEILNRISLKGLSEPQVEALIDTLGAVKANLSGEIAARAAEAANGNGGGNIREPV